MHIHTGILWTAVLAGGAAAAVLAACRAQSPVREDPSNTPVTISLVYAYQNSQWNAAVEEVVRQFETDHPQIHVEYKIRYAGEVYEDLLNKLAAREELGDVVQLKEPSAYAESGLIAPLPPEAAERAACLCSVDGTPYAAAAVLSTTGVVYNRAVFERYGLTPPETYGEFLSHCSALRRQGVTPIGVGGRDLWHLEYWLNHFLRTDVLSRAPDFLARCRTGERDWNDPLVTEMLTHLSGLFGRGYVDENWRSTPDSALAYHMAEGEVAMVCSGPWLALDVLALDPEAELGWFYVPGPEGTTVAGESLDVYWAVTASCAQSPERYQAAAEFLTFFYSDAIYPAVCDTVAGTPATVDGARWDEPREGIAAEIAAAAAAADRTERAYVGDADTPAGFEKRLLTLVVELCGGERTVAETQELAQACWEQCLQQEAVYDG